MRTPAETAKKVVEVQPMMGGQYLAQPLIITLPYRFAKPYILKSVKYHDWQPEPSTDENLKEALVDSLAIAWHEFNGMNPIGFECALARTLGWLWLGFPDFSRLIGVMEGETQPTYGKELLEQVSELFKYNHADFMEAEKKRAMN